MSRSAEDVYADRVRMIEQFPMLSLAFSLGGRRGSFIAPLGEGVALGGFVLVPDDRGGSIVAQVESVTATDRPIAQLEATVEFELSDGTTTNAVRAAPMRHVVTGELALLGRLTDAGFEPGPPLDGFGERPFLPASTEQTRVVREGLAAGRPALAVGVVDGHDDLDATLRSQGFSRHTFLCGQSGSGKTYATGVLLERLRLETTLPIVIFDPNSDHVHLGEVRDDAAGTEEAERYRRLGGDVLVCRARDRGGNGLLAVHLSDLPVHQQALLFGLDPVEDLEEFGVIRSVTATLPSPFSVQDVIRAATALDTDAAHRLAVRITNLGVADWGVWCREGERSLVDAAPLQHQCLVLDLGSLSLPAERLMVATGVLLWLWSRREEKSPVLLVADEAHNLFPANPSTPAERAAAEVGVAIAAEGRKYGLHLLVATQRPSKVHINVVSQCDNLVLLRLNSVADVVDLSRLFSHVPAGLIAQSPEFRQGELLFAGPISEVPTRARIGRRLSPEGGGDVPTTWA